MMGGYGLWGWLALGLALIAIETLGASGSFLLWIGVAALVMGLVTAIVPVPWPMDLALFAGLCVVSVLVGWRVYRTGKPVLAGGGLNDRLASLKGQDFELMEGTENGYGTIRVADSVWRVRGPALPAGHRVRVTGVDGSTLLVENAQ
jgi:inner membrane protein